MIENLESQCQTILDKKQNVKSVPPPKSPKSNISINIHNYFGSDDEERSYRKQKSSVQFDNELRSADDVTEEYDIRSISSTEDDRSDRRTSVIIINKIVHVHNAIQSPSSKEEVTNSPRRNKSFIHSATQDIKKIMPSGKIQIRMIKRGRKDSFTFKSNKPFESVEDEIQHVRGEIYKLRQTKVTEESKQQIAELTDRLRRLTISKTNE
jgi:hypothetical protein